MQDARRRLFDDILRGGLSNNDADVRTHISEGLVPDTPLRRRVFFKELRFAFCISGCGFFAGRPEFFCDDFNSFTQDLSKKPLCPFLEDRIIEKLLSCHRHLDAYNTQKPKIAAFLRVFYDSRVLVLLKPHSCLDICDETVKHLKEKIEEERIEEERIEEERINNVTASVMI